MLAFFFCLWSSEQADSVASPGTQASLPAARNILRRYGCLRTTKKQPLCRFTLATLSATSCAARVTPTSGSPTTSASHRAPSRNSSTSPPSTRSSSSPSAEPLASTCSAITPTRSPSTSNLATCPHRTPRGWNNGRIFAPRMQRCTNNYG